MGNAQRDQNYVPTLIGVSNADGQTPVTLYVDPVTHRLLVSIAGGGSVAGSDTQVQFNDAGSFGADSGFTYDKTTHVLTVSSDVKAARLLAADTNASNYLVIKAGSDLTADRILTITTGDAARGVTLAGDINLAANFTTSGANALTLTTTGPTNVTLPTTGTLATLSNKLSDFAATSSAELAGVISDETGSGALVFANSPTLVTPTLGSAGATAIGIGKAASASIRLEMKTDGTFTSAARVEADVSTALIYSAYVTGDGQLRFAVNAAGAIAFGDGTNVADTNLYRSAADTLKTDDSFVVGATLTIGTLTGLLKGSTGVVSAATADVDYVTPTGTVTLSNKTLTAPKFADGGLIADNNGNEQIVFHTTASAVNQVEITNAATGTTGPLIAPGGETNIDLRLAGKGTGAVHHTSGVYGDITAYSPAGGATATLTLNTSNIHAIIMPAGNITIALSNEHVGQCFMIRILQDSGGSRTVTWFSTIKWAGGSAPTLTTTASKADLFGFIVTSAGNYDGVIIAQNI